MGNILDSKYRITPSGLRDEFCPGIREWTIKGHFQTLNLVVLPHACEKFELISEWFIKQKRTKVDFISNAVRIRGLIGRFSTDTG